MIPFRKSYLLAAPLALAALVALTEIVAYNAVFLPSIQYSYLEYNGSFFTTTNYGPGDLVVGAPLAFRGDCQRSHYGCFDWVKFPGAGVVIAFHGGSDEQTAILVERHCIEARCAPLDGFEAVGYWLDADEYRDVTSNFSTQINCVPFSHEYAIKYEVQFCTNTTYGYDRVILESRYAKIQGPFSTRYVSPVDYSVHFSVVTDYGTQQTYRKERW